MIVVKIPFRGQSVADMNNWLVDNGLVYRRDWEWDNDGNGNYVYKISQTYYKLADFFILKWS